MCVCAERRKDPRRRRRSPAVRGEGGARPRGREREGAPRGVVARGNSSRNKEISSVDRSNKTALLRTLLRSLFKSSAREPSGGVMKL